MRFFWIPIWNDAVGQNNFGCKWEVVVSVRASDMMQSNTASRSPVLTGNQWEPWWQVVVKSKHTAKAIGRNEFHQ